MRQALKNKFYELVKKRLIYTSLKTLLFLRVQQQRRMETEGWILNVRKEFPGLSYSKHWIVCDSPGGTQVHQV